MSSLVGIGLMSGTSLDGLDIVAARFFLDKPDTYDYEIVASQSLGYSDQWQSRLANLMDQSAEIFAKTHVYYGHFLGKALQEFVAENQLTPDFIGVHGHTIFHQPEKNFTTQIGDGETIASYLPCPIVTNFRSKDVALGGQGAPLVPMGERYLFPDCQLFLNLGGFCNLAVGEIAFDIGSCNGILNFLTQMIDPSMAYDKGGAFAASGTFLSELFEELQAMPFYAENPPKSLGWEWVRDQLLPLMLASPSSPIDKLHTYCIHIADQIHHALEKMGRKEEEILISGGGVHNSFLMECIHSRLAELGIQAAQPSHKEFVDFKEALVFAFLALRTLTSNSTVLASVTGASLDAITGSIHLPATTKMAWFN